MQNPGILQSTTRTIHIDIDPAEIGKNMETNIPLVGDARLVLEQIMEQKPALDTADWLDTLRGWKREEPEKPAQHADGTADPHAFLALLSAKMEPDGIYVADVGQNQIWSARAVNLRGGRFLTSGGMGTMGYALPAALGAKLAAPGTQVVAVCGDGALQMSMMELATLCQHGINVKLVVLCNHCLGMVRELQDNAYGGNRFAVALDGSPDFAVLASAYGMSSRTVRSDEEAGAAIDALLQSEKPFLLQVMTDPEQSL